MFRLLRDLDADIRAGVIARFRTEWTHHSTAIEGNSLTLGETAFVLGEGLTIAGKPLKDHQEVMGHARAFDWLMDWVGALRPVTEEDLFDLHRMVQVEVVHDTQKPVGAWKREPNGSYVVLDERSVFNDTYAEPRDVPTLMQVWLQSLNAGVVHEPDDDDAALDDYVRLHAGFVRVHPFADGNGRLVRLLANLPLLAHDRPPVMILREKRQDYIRSLARWQIALGRPRPDAPLAPEPERLAEFRALVADCWKISFNILDEARSTQMARGRDPSAR